MGKFNFVKTSIEGVTVIEPTVFGDQRGYFMETYNKAEFDAAGLNVTFVAPHCPPLSSSSKESDAVGGPERKMGSFTK